MECDLSTGTFSCGLLYTQTAPHPGIIAGGVSTGFIRRTQKRSVSVHAPGGSIERQDKAWVSIVFTTVLSITLMLYESTL